MSMKFNVSDFKKEVFGAAATIMSFLAVFCVAVKDADFS